MDCSLAQVHTMVKLLLSDAGPSASVSWILPADTTART